MKNKFGFFKSGLFILLSSLVSANAAHAAGEKNLYLTLSHGTSTSVANSAVGDGISGKAMGLAFELQSGGVLAWDFFFKQTSFDAKTIAFDLADLGGSGTVNISLQLKNRFVGTGPRVFLLKFFNAHAGLGYTNLSVTTTVGGAEVSSSTGVDGGSGMGLYYGGGAQIPIGSFELGADYTIVSMAENFKTNNILGNLRIRF